MSAEPYSKVPAIDPVLLGRLVLGQCRALRMDRHQVACLADIDDYKVAIIEDGQAEDDDMPEAARVCRALGVDLSAVLLAGKVGEAA